MGQKKSKPVQDSHLEISDQATSLASDGREVLFEREEVDVLKDTVYTSQPVRFKDQQKFELTVDGAAVLRIGLLTERPQHKYFTQDAVFETEDGFGPEMSTRSLYINHIGNLCYGEPEAEREYLPLYGLESLYIYILVIYGKPKLSAKSGGKRTEWSAFEDSSIGIQGSGSKAICGLISSAECCMVKEELIPEHTYLLHWKMELSQQIVAGKQSVFGFIRVGIAAKKPASLHNIDMKLSNSDIIWCTESAITNYPYNGTLAVLVNLSEGTVKHNILKTSVGETTTDSLHLGTDKPHTLYMVAEISHGSLTVTHGANIDVMQHPGSTVYVKNYKEFPTQRDLHFDIARHGYEPCRILYGIDPKSFVVELREEVMQKVLKTCTEYADITPAYVTRVQIMQAYLQHTNSQICVERPLIEEEAYWALKTDIIKLSRELTRDIQQLDETRSIQVSGVPESFEEFELKLFFTRPEACGGDTIVSLGKDKDFRSVWIIVYESAEVARRVCKTSQYNIDGHQVAVLPYYQEIGCSVNKGEKPDYNREPFTVSTERLDEDKIRFVRNRDIEMNKLKQFVRNKSGASVDWLDQEILEEDSDDEEDGDTLWVECVIPSTDYKRLAEWKNNAQSAVMKYFNEEITDKCLQLESTTWNASLLLIEQLGTTKNFDYVPDEETKSIKLISNSFNVIKTVSNELGKAQPEVEQSSFKLSGVHAERFIAVDAENKVHQLAKRYRGTRFSVDRAKLEIDIAGPQNEINNIKTDLQELMLLAKDVSIELSQEWAQIAKEAHEKISNEFKRQGLNDRVKISNRTVSLCTVVENEPGAKRKKEKMQQCIEHVIKENKFDVADNMMNGVWETLKGNFEERYGVIMKRKKQCVRIVGTADSVNQAKKVVQSVIASNMPQSRNMYISGDVAEYLAIYEFTEETSATCTFEHEDDQYTGKILLKGDIEEQVKTKTEIDKASKEINTFWFSVSKPWLASIIESIPINRVATKHMCLITIEIGDSLASMGVSAISILTGRNVVIQAKQSNIVEMTVDVLVNVASPDMTANSTVAQAIVSAGGHAIESECLNYVKSNGRIPEGGVVLTKAGILPCRGIIHAVIPQWKDGKSNERTSLQFLIRNVMQVADKEKFFSIAFPVSDMGHGGFPVDAAVDCTLKAMKDYFEQNSSSSIEAVYLCYKPQGDVALLQKTVQKHLNSKPWFSFVPDRALSSEVQRPTSARLKSGRSTTSTGARKAQNPFSWGVNEGIPTGSFRWKGGQREEDLDDQKQIDDEREASGGMPYKIDLTENIRLHIVKGSIEKQKVDVIVNTTINFPEIAGAVSNAIRKAGGSSIIAECRKNSDGKLKYGQVFQTSGGNLSCKRLYHVMIENAWADKTYSNVYQTVRTCLEEASKFKCVSIAFPTFGTGLSKFPPDKVADAMIRSVNKFITQNRVTSLRDVHIVVFYADAETIQIFEANVRHILHDLRSKYQYQTKRDGRPGPRKQRAGYKAPKDYTEHAKADDVLMVKVTSKKSKREEIKQDFEKLVNEEYVTKELHINSEKDEEVLSKNEEAMLRLLEKDHGIKVEIDTRKRKVNISGLRKDVQKAEGKAHNMLVRQFPETRFRKKMAQIVVEHVQWLYEDTDGTKKPVSQESNLDIHIGYIRGVDFTYKNRTEDGDTVTEYRVVVGKLEEHPVNDSSKKRRLYQRNKELAGIDLPVNWKIYAGDLEEEQIVLPVNHPEFTTVKNKFIKDGCKPTSIKSITRIENKYMWLQYQSKRCQLERQNPKGTQNERQLWHGTDGNTYNTIIKNGYDRSFAGKNATVYGTGTYFATKSSYSDRYALPDASGTRRMFLSKVLTGMFILGNNGMDVLPRRIDSKEKVVCYDSAVDHQSRPQIFVIFHDTQAYPEYMIAYK